MEIVCQPGSFREPGTSLKILAAIFDAYLEILQYPW